MKRAAVWMLTAFAVTVCATVVRAEPAFDVAGFKLGMAEENAIAGLKTHNAKFIIDQPMSKLEGIAEPVKPLVTARTSFSPGADTETMALAFTMPPGPKVLWAIQRTMSYVPEHRPSVDASLAALRQKYGPESIPPPPGYGIGAANLAWIFDAQGNLLSAAAARGPWMNCTSLLQNHLANNDQQSFNDLQTGLTGARAQAATLAIITASVQYTMQHNNQPEVTNLIVTITDGRRYGAAITATRQQVMAAVDSRTKKETQDVNQRPAPSL